MNLFAHQEAENVERHRPLAARMRPRSLDEFVGQQHILGPGKMLRRMIAAGRLGSLIFYGPPGTGKTTLANLLAQETGGTLKKLSAVTSGVKELREILAWAQNEVASGGLPPLLFIDEIHRFNRAQQDALLPDVEEGIVNLIGATTSNPYFAVNGALLSRSQVFHFQPLSEEDLVQLMQRALRDRQRGLGAMAVEVVAGSLEALARWCEGDARRALTVLEIAVRSTPDQPVRLTVELLGESMQQKTLQYDPTGDEHYDVASALIKSIRGSDPDAALYWLARMLEAGEDLRFLCRRLVILASEDVGNADPQALPLAVAAAQACELVGLPECQLTLAQAVTYLACTEKSNAATKAIAAARREVREGALIPVPLHLRDAHYSGAAELGHGKGYQYAHDAPDGVVDQDYLGVDREFYQPTVRGWEGKIAARLESYRQRFRQARAREQ
ncbi:MAG: ATPase AAA [Pirellulaceae bacterium]|nr:MAG: ATPase AAA [Pirellulaceae bacterium]